MTDLDIVLYRSGSRWATPWEEAFAAGLRRHGVAFEQRPQAEWRVSDLAVIWAHRQRPLFDAQRAAGKHYLVMERGYVGDRMAWTSLGLDGLNGRARFPRAPDGARWGRHFADLLRPWSRAAGGTGLVIGQVPGDAALCGLDVAEWSRGVRLRLSQIGLSTRFRPHPLSDTPPARSLAEDLAGAALVVTFNSNAGVLAVLAGVPTVALDRGSMAWPVAGHALDETVRPDRTGWAHDLAWAQWTEAEIAAGTPWPHIAPLLERGDHDAPDA